MNYKSKFEATVADYFGKQVKYEPDRISFTQPPQDRTYCPDFKIAENVYIETKGRLTVEDRKKHKWFKEQHPDITVIFLFLNSMNTLTKKSRTTYGEWADDNNIPYYCWRTNPPPSNTKEIIKHVCKENNRTTRRKRKL